MSAQREFAPTNIQNGGQIIKIVYFCQYNGFTGTITKIIYMK